MEITPNGHDAATEERSAPHYQIGLTKYGHQTLHWTTNGTTSLCSCPVTYAREFKIEVDEGHICRHCERKKAAGASSPTKPRKKWGTGTPSVTPLVRTPFELKAAEFDALATELRELREQFRIKKERFDQLREEMEKFIDSANITAD